MKNLERGHEYYKDNKVLNYRAIDDEEYFPLQEFKEATKRFLLKLDDIIDVCISYIDENNEQVKYGFYTSKFDSKRIIEEIIVKLKNEYSFMKNILKMKVGNFYGNFGFEAKCDGKTFVESSSIKR